MVPLCVVNVCGLRCSRSGSGGGGGGRRGARGPVERRHLVGPEVVEPAVPVVQFGGRVVVHRHRQADAAVHVVEDRGHPRGPARPGTCPGRRHPGRAGAAAPGCRRPRAPRPPGRCPSTGTARRPRPPATRRAERRRGAVRGPGSGWRRAAGRRPPGHGVHPVEDPRGPWIGGPGLRLLLVGQQHGAQREDLVDLRRVVQVARALRRHLRMVREDDRRGEQERARRPVTAGRLRRRPAEHGGR